MKKNPMKVVYAFFLTLMIMLLINNMIAMFNRSEELTESQLVELINKTTITNTTITPDQGIYVINGIYEKDVNGFKVPKQFKTTILNQEYQIKKITDLLDEKKINYKVNPYVAPFDWFGIIFNVASFGLMGFLLFSMMRGKAPGTETKINIIQNVKTRFSDVIGYEEEKKELEEITDFLKYPQKYVASGAKLPSGVLLEGPPGTGKTLMARAVAGEANVSFFSASGSDFEEMYVGLGASRIRKLFKEAKKLAPSIVFIDEIDAIGSRDKGKNANPTLEQTINALLVEMDGIEEDTDPAKRVVVIAATNRKENLDKALLRPGRLDRQILVDLPSIKTREEILKYHAKNKKVASSVNYQSLARSTSGMSGAELAAVCNEAAILTVRDGINEITQPIFQEAIDRVLMGPAKITNKYSEKDKKVVSFHESGHAIVGLELEGAMEVQKITIIPRRDAGGYVSYIPSEDEQRFITKSELEAKITSLLAGRVSEELFINEITVGAFNDFEVATNMARSMVTKYGMSDLGTYQFEANGAENLYANKQYSDTTAQKIDDEINRILENCKNKAKEILLRRKDDVFLLAKTIQEVEVLDKEQIDYLMEHRCLPDNTVENIYRPSTNINNEEKITKVNLDKNYQEPGDDDKVV